MLLYEYNIEISTIKITLMGFTVKGPVGLKIVIHDSTNKQVFYLQYLEYDTCNNANAVDRHSHCQV